MAESLEPTSLLLLYWGRRGGGARMTFELARAFGRHAGVRTRASISDRCELRGEIVGTGVPVDEARLPSSVRRLPLEVPRLVGSWCRVLRTVDRERPALVIVVMGSPWSDAIARPFGWLVRRRGGHLIRFVHDAVAHPGDPHRSPSWLTRAGMRAADRYVVLSDHVGAQLRDAGVSADRIVCSEHGPFSLGSPRDRVGEPHDPFRLLFFGRLAEYKGLDLLVAAARSLDDRGVRVEVRIVGDGPVDLGRLPANVTVDRRWVAEPELRDTLVWADAVVLPYVEASQSGVAPMATALGLPLVVTPVGGLVEQVEAGRTAMVAASVDSSALADAIVDLAADRERYREMAEHCVAVSAVGDAWDAIVDDLLTRCGAIR
jgi:glycosyltransferase involved in cell wall biosynthesis